MSEFVSSEIAHKLKEKGFPLLRVIKQRGEPIIYDLPKNHPNWQNCNAYYIPTTSQVLKWLRDEKDIFIEITVDVNDKFNYYFEIYKKGNDTWEYIGQNDTYDYFEMYEETAMAGIEWVLDNILL